MSHRARLGLPLGPLIILRRMQAVGLLCLLSCTVGLAPARADNLPAPWTHLPINASKPRTEYSMDAGPDRPADASLVHARSRRSASVVAQTAQIDLRLRPWVHWRWQIRQQPDQADIALAAREDAAARLIFFFDGDEARLPWGDRMVMAAARRLGSRPLPYATLMYVSAPGRSEGEVIANPYTRRIQMMVVDGSADGGGTRWRHFSRDLQADYLRVFGAPPGRLLGWGFMTDSDNTRSQAEALYEPVRWSSGP